MPACDCESCLAIMRCTSLTQSTSSFARIRRLGIRNLQVDDYLMMFALVWYTLLCVALNRVVAIGGSNLMDEYDIKHLTPSIKAERISGSKWVFVSEHSFLIMTWTLKSCMLVIYARITYVFFRDHRSTADKDLSTETGYVRSD